VTDNLIFDSRDEGSAKIPLGWHPLSPSSRDWTFSYNGEFVHVATSTGSRDGCCRR